MFYGFSEDDNKCISQDFLHQQMPQVGSPWIYIGDFNQILSQDEKLTGAPTEFGGVESFNRALVDYNMLDLGCVGYAFYNDPPCRYDIITLNCVNFNF